MKIRLASDLHFEFVRDSFKEKSKDFKDRFKNHINSVIEELDTDSESVLLLPGDVDIFKHLHKSISILSERFKYIIFVPGNHEFYSGNLPTAVNKIRDSLKKFSNVFVLNKNSILLDQVLFIGCTLWSDMNLRNPLTMYFAKLQMNDYSNIRTGPDYEPWKKHLDPQNTVDIHYEHKKFVFEKLKENKDRKIVVLTHHAPSFLSIPDQFKGEDLNGCYASELGYQIEEFGPDLWVHGHIHDSKDYTIGNTRIATNPYGYYNSGINPDFNSKFLIEV